MHRLFSLLLIACFCSVAVAQDLSSPAPRRRVARPVRAQQPKEIPAAPKDEKLFTKYVLNFGSHTEFYNNIQTDASGTMRKFDFAPTIGFGAIMPINEELKFLPEVNWVLPRKAGSSEIIKNLFMLRADLGYDPVDWLRLRIGTSIMWLNQHGKGGSAQVNNGNGTSTFYYPDENRSSLNNTLDVGVEAMLDQWAVRLQTYTYSVFKEQRRQLSYTLLVSYYWDR